LAGEQFPFLFLKWTGFLWQLELAGGNEYRQRRADVFTLVSRETGHKAPCR